MGADTCEQQTLTSLPTTGSLPRFFLWTKEEYDTSRGGSVIEKLTCSSSHASISMCDVLTRSLYLLPLEYSTDIEESFTWQKILTIRLHPENDSFLPLAEEGSSVK
jgi:hypothetical protein